MLGHFLNPPNWFTSASIFCSVYALTLLMGAGASPEADILVRACVLIVFGGIFDLLDGRVARMTRRYSEFGVQLDSIADIIGFGVSPALVAWSWKLHALGPVGVGIAFWYVVCTAFRLARFNVATASDSWDLDGFSQGLTSTMSGGILVTLVWMSNGYLHASLDPSPVAIGAFVGLLGLLMVSSVPYRNFKDLRSNPTARRYLGVALSCCLAAGVVLDPSMWWGMGAVLYLVWGTVDGLITLARRDRQGDDGALPHP